MEPCSRCGHVDRQDHAEPRNLCQSPDAECCDFCTRLHHMNAEIARGKAVVQDLMDQRDEHMSRVNHAHPSIIDRLPVEVASIIFVFYASMETRKTSPLTLGAVCRKWRQIVWSTPAVWTSVSIIISGSRTRKLETRVQLVKDWLSRSGQLPLSISITVHSLKTSDEEHPQIHRLIDIINQHCNQWFFLDLSMPASQIARFDASACVSSALHKLSLSSPEDANLTIHNLSQLTPRIVEIHVLRLHPLSLNWAHVTDFTMGLLPVDWILQIFRLAPSLRACHFDFVSCQHVESPAEAYSHVTHSQLESLDIEISFEEAEGLFLNNITLPALKHLDIRGYDIDLNADHLVPFLARSSSNLKSLSVDETDYAGEGLIRITQLTPSLQKLCITLGYADEGYLDLFYQALTGHLPTAENLTPIYAEPLLPSLRTFQWTGDGAFPWEVVPEFLVQLSQDSGSCRRPLEEIKIYCERDEGDPIPYIDEDVTSQLSEFTDQVKFHFTYQLDKGWRGWGGGDLFKLSLEKISEEKQ